MDVVGLGQTVQDAGPWVALFGVVVAGLRAIVSGALVPRGTLDVLNQQWEARLRESTERERQWRTAYEHEAAAGDIRDAQLARLTSTLETTDHVLQSLPRKDA